MKKFLSLLLALTMIFSLCACGEKSGKQETTFATLGSDYDVELPIFAITKYSASYGTTVNYSDYETDENGRITKYVFDIESEKFAVDWIYDEDGHFSRPDSEYVYDDKNNIIKIGKTEYLYDENGLIIEERYDGETDTTYQYKLDSEKRVSYAEVKNTSKHTYEYTYDALGLPTKYTINNYGIAIDEDNNTLSTTYDVEVEISPLGFLTKESKRRIYDSKQRNEDDYDVVAEYDIVGSYLVKSTDDDRFMPVSKFIAFDENKQIPKPDSVLSGITYITTNEGRYVYQLDETSSDSSSKFKTFVHAFDIQNNNFPNIMTPTKSLCEESNYLFFSYMGVLKALGLNTNISADGQATVTDNSGNTIACITKTIDSGKYVLNMELY